MAQATYADRYLRRVGFGLEAFAAKKGWNAEEYRVFVKFDEEWEKFYVAFVVPEESGIDDLKQKQLGGYPKLNSPLDFILTGRDLDIGDFLDHVLLWVITTSEYEQGGIYALGPDYRPIEEYLK